MEGEGQDREKKFLPAAHVVVALDKPSPTSSKGRFGYCGDLEFVLVFGAVVKAGKYDVSEHDITISDLIRRAGGLTPKTKAPKIQIFRKTPQGNKCILVNTQAALNEKRSEYDLFLRRYDVIIVE